MKAIPKHYRLVKEHGDSYEIHDVRDKKHFHIAKKDLDLAMHAKLSKVQKFSEGGEAQAEPEKPSESAPITVNVNAPEPQADRAPASMLDSQRDLAGVNAGQPVPVIPASSILDQERQAANVRPAVVPIAPTNVPSTPSAAPPQIPVVPRPASLVGQARGAQALAEKGIRTRNDAEAEENLANAATIQANNDRLKATVDAYQENRKKLDDEHQKLTQDVVDQKIDPNRWFQDKSIPGKISTAIGVILGGIGAGLQHSNTNQALAVVQEQIRNDIDAQKANLGKKQTLLSMNLEKYKNMDAAMAATMAQMNAMVTGQLQLNAARSGSQKAKGNADYAIGELRNKRLLEMPNLALQDLKLSQLHQLEGTRPAPSAASHISGTSPAASDLDSGPSQGDILREQSLLAGKKIPVDPYRYGTGVNQDRLTALKITGAVDKETGHKATEEYGKYMKLQHELKEADSVFNIAARNATRRGRIARGVNPHALALAGGAIGGAAGLIGAGIGAVPGAGLGASVGESIGQGIRHFAALGDEATKQYNAVVEPFVDKLAKDVTGRSTPISIEKLSNLLPEQGDSPATLAIKRAKLFDTLKSSYSFPTLVEHKLVHPHDPMIVLNSQED